MKANKTYYVDHGLQLQHRSISLIIYGIRLFLTVSDCLYPFVVMPKLLCSRRIDLQNHCLKKSPVYYLQQPRFVCNLSRFPLIRLVAMDGSHGLEHTFRQGTLISHIHCSLVICFKGILTHHRVFLPVKSLFAKLIARITKKRNLQVLTRQSSTV